MIDKTLIERLHDSGVINKNFVLWWQLGFEGRRIYSKEEFQKNLQYKSYQEEHLLADKDGNLLGADIHETEVLVWPHDDVPIHIQDFNLFQKSAPVSCFITLKPMSHDYNAGWRSSQFWGDSFRPEIYYQPHIRGIVLEVTKDFMFWYSFKYPGGRANSYQTYALRPSQEGRPPILIEPVSPSKFYNNLNSINLNKTLEKRPTTLDFKNGGLSFAPYYDFNPFDNQATIYPANLFPGKLDAPILIKGGAKGPEILGVSSMGIPYLDWPLSATYWKLDQSLEKKAKTSLIKRLGLI